MVLFLLHSLSGVGERPGIQSEPVHRRAEQGRHAELQGINYFELKRNENSTIEFRSPHRVLLSGSHVPSGLTYIPRQT